MMSFNKEYDDEIRDIVKNHPKQYLSILQCKGVHPERTKDRTYLKDYIITNTPLLSEDKHTFKTRIFWYINNISEFPRCSNTDCNKPLVNFNVKSLIKGYPLFCCNECKYSSDIWKKRMENGVMENYGVRNYFMSDVFKKKYSVMKDEVEKKKYNTHKINNSFNISEKENSVYRILLEKYSENDIIRQYCSDERYPFKCDFYIKSTDTFIEYNGSWTHGEHPFNENSEEDREKLECWKSKDTAFYDNAIETWTVRDVQKREIAKKNSLNYVEIWTLTELRKWIGLNTIRNYDNIFIEWDRKKANYDYNYLYNAIPSKLIPTTGNHNYIIKYFQQDVFFKTEKTLWMNNDIRDKLISNRCRYLNKEERELTHSDILTGFKKSGIYYGYSHFNPLWFKWFICQYGIKTCYDPCGGWGHRLLGGLSLERYIYNDLSKSTKENVDKIISFFNIKNTVTYNNDASHFIPEEDFEAMFTCPPYFNVEHYECGDFKDRGEFDRFIDSLFDIFKSKDSCRIFGMVIREDMLGNHTDFVEKLEINVNGESYFDGKANANREFLYVFRK